MRNDQMLADFLVAIHDKERPSEDQALVGRMLETPVYSKLIDSKSCAIK